MNSFAEMGACLHPTHLSLVSALKGCPFSLVHMVVDHPCGFETRAQCLSPSWSDGSVACSIIRLTQLGV